MNKKHITYIILGAILLVAIFASLFYFLSAIASPKNLGTASIFDSIGNAIGYGFNYVIDIFSSGFEYITGIFGLTSTSLDNSCDDPQPLPKGSIVDIDDYANTITVIIPYRSVSSMCFAPDIETVYSKAIVTPASGEPVDFTNPVTYTVNQDGNIKSYIVTVRERFFDPNNILDCLDLQTLGTNLNGVFKLSGDIDCNGFEFTPIGNSSQPFTGTLNGNGYVISNLDIKYEGADNVGLFGVTSNATIENVKIVEGSILGKSYVGGLIGNSQNNTNITNSYFSGNVTGTGSHIGGLVGYMNGTIDYSHFSGIIDNPGTKTDSHCAGLCSSDNQWVGGLVGRSNGTISKSYFEGTLTSFAMYVGGLAGFASNISNSYAIGNIRGVDKVGGLASTANTVTNSYSKVNITWTRDGRVSCSYYGTCVLGGILGTGSSSSIDRVFTEAYMDPAGLAIDVYALAGYGKYVNIRDSSFLSNHSGASSHKGVVRDNIVGAPNSGFFKNISNLPLNLWDFENVWNIDSNVNNGYPYLRPYLIDPVLSFTSSASVIDEGQTLTLTWNVLNADSCTSSGGSSGWAGLRSVTAGDNSWTSDVLTAGNYTYNISCSNSTGGIVDNTISVEVRPILPPPEPIILNPSSNKAIVSFQIGPYVGSINTLLSQTVVVIVPVGTNISSLPAPIITVSPYATISPASGIYQDFYNNPVTYTVTAQDGSRRDYIVTVRNP